MLRILSENNSPKMPQNKTRRNHPQRNGIIKINRYLCKIGKLNWRDKKHDHNHVLQHQMKGLLRLYFFITLPGVGIVIKSWSVNSGS